MAMISLAYDPTDAALAARLTADLRVAGDTVVEGAQTGRAAVLIVLVSPRLTPDSPVMQAIYNALDQGQVIVPALTGGASLPPELDHLRPVDLNARYDVAALRARIAEGQQATWQPRVRTPKVRQSNRRTVVWVAAIALFVFVFGLWSISTFKLQAPPEDYGPVYTLDAQTRDAILRPTMEFLSTSLPRSTQQAADFPATLNAVPTLIRPFIASTTTAIYNALAGIYPTVTPTPGRGDEEF